jgi:hypothetical protein
MRHTFARLTGALAMVVLAGCAAPSPSAPSPTASAPATAVASSASTAPPPTSRPAVDADACPVTHPRRFVPPPGVSYAALFGADSSHGNGQLWVGGLSPSGAILITKPDPDGWLSWKFGWYRVTPGRLTITGRRLDASAPPARASVPDGYGDTGFQSTAVIFPTAGCWEITGTVGPTAITFVTLVNPD